MYIFPYTVKAFGFLFKQISLHIHGSVQTTAPLPRVQVGKFNNAVNISQVSLCDRYFVTASHILEYLIFLSSNWFTSGTDSRPWRQKMA